MKNDIEQYEKIREQTEKLFERTTKVKSPVLGEVYFNSDGLKHLMYTSGGRVERSKIDQLTKFKLFPIAKKIIEIATTLQEYDEQLVTVRVRRHKKPATTESRLAKYWGLIAILNGTKAKVIVRQVGDGQKHFWSVMPDWNRNKHSNITLIKKCSGDLEND